MMCFEPLFRYVLKPFWSVWGRINDRNIENQANDKAFLILGIIK